MRWLSRVISILTVLAVAGPLEGQSTGQIGGRVTSDLGAAVLERAVERAFAGGTLRTCEYGGSDGTAAVTRAVLNQLSG